MLLSILDLLWMLFLPQILYKLGRYKSHIFRPNQHDLASSLNVNFTLCFYVCHINSKCVSCIVVSIRNAIL